MAKQIGEPPNTMFYTGIARLLNQASVALATEGEFDDDRSGRQRRLIVTLTRRIGTVMPLLFGAVEAEIAILETACKEMRELMGARFAADALCTFDAAVPGTGPLVQYRRLLVELDEAAARLHQSADEPWVRKARERLRLRLAEIVAVEADLVNAMLVD